MRKAKSYSTDFWVSLVKNRCDQLDPKCMNECMNWADFLHVACDAVIFGKTNIVPYMFGF